MPVNRKKMVWGRNPGILKCDSAKTQYFMGDLCDSLR